MQLTQLAPLFKIVVPLPSFLFHPLLMYFRHFPPSYNLLTALSDQPAFFGLKRVSAIFYQIFIFHQIITLQKLWKMFFISSKNLFLFLRYLNFCRNDVHQMLAPDSFLILLNNPKQPLHARIFFKNKLFWKRIIEKP